MTLFLFKFINIIIYRNIQQQKKNIIIAYWFQDNNSAIMMGLKTLEINSYVNSRTPPRFRSVEHMLATQQRDGTMTLTRKQTSVRIFDQPTTKETPFIQFPPKYLHIKRREVKREHKKLHLFYTSNPLHYTYFVFRKTKAIAKTFLYPLRHYKILVINHDNS